MAPKRYGAVFERHSHVTRWRRTGWLGSGHTAKTRHQKRPAETGGRNGASIAKFRTRRPAHICETSRYRFKRAQLKKVLFSRHSPRRNLSSCASRIGCQEGRRRQGGSNLPPTDLHKRLKTARYRAVARLWLRLSVRNLGEERPRRLPVLLSC
jgi:hypothetical protein